MANNIKLSDDDYKFIKGLAKFDLVMLLSEINDHGWEGSQETIRLMKQALRKS